MHAYYSTYVPNTTYPHTCTPILCMSMRVDADKHGAVHGQSRTRDDAVTPITVPTSIHSSTTIPSHCTDHRHRLTPGGPAAPRISPLPWQGNVPSSLERDSIPQSPTPSLAHDLLDTRLALLLSPLSEVLIHPHYIPSISSSCPALSRDKGSHSGRGD